MTSYKLVYFDLKGRAEVSRILFDLADKTYEDKRLKFEEWPTAKLNTPFLQAPVLEIKNENGTFKIAQSLAIQRYLANVFNFAGKNEIERAQADMISEQVNDLFQLLVSIYKRSNSEEKSKDLETALNVTIPSGLKFIQNLLEENKNGNGFLVGDSLTYSDIVLMCFYDWLRENKHRVLENLPLLKQHDEKIRNYPKIKEHLEKSSQTRLTILFPN